MPPSVCVNRCESRQFENSLPVGVQPQLEIDRPAYVYVHGALVLVLYLMRTVQNAVVADATQGIPQ